MTVLFKGRVLPLNDCMHALVIMCIYFCTYRKLAGKTIFISGASRGIGKAIALKAAKDGANIVIAAKTAQAHPKLLGTIYTAAKEGCECICDILFGESFFIVVVYIMYCS